MQIGEKVSLYRTLRGYSMHKLSELSGLSQSTISNIESNKRSPQIDTLEKICRALNIRLVDILPSEHTQLTIQEQELILLLHKMSNEEGELLLNILKSFIQHRN